MLYFLDQGYRVIAHDRRGHGRSSQVGDGHDMDHYAADVAALVSHLDLRDAVHVGHGMCTTHADVISPICWRSSSAESL